MHLSGIDFEGKSKELVWHLTAENNHGPEVPCTPAIIIARKLVRGEIETMGAIPCLGLISLEDFDLEVESFEISWQSGLECLYKQ